MTEYQTRQPIVASGIYPAPPSRFSLGDPSGSVEAGSAANGGRPAGRRRAIADPRDAASLRR